MGFRSWNIFDLEHVSALQARRGDDLARLVGEWSPAEGWYLSKTLPKTFELERVLGVKGVPGWYPGSLKEWPCRLYDGMIKVARTPVP